MKTVLKVENLQKYYGGKGNVTKAVNGIGFSVEKGEFIGIMGASGSGKTTLLNCISTIDTSTGGHIVIDGTDVTGMKQSALSKFRREKLGFIFQEFNLLDTLTARENIALALSILRRNASEITEKTNNVMKLLGIYDVAEKYPYQMSGGQRQRVACARAIVTEPSLVLADEPTGALDSRSARMLLESLSSLNERLEATILMVTHDAFTASWCGRILFIKDGELFCELIRGDESRKEFFDRIMEVVALLGGELDAD